MLAILLSVLKIIGIVLLSVLGLVVLLILLVLFVPIRYQVKAFKNEDEDNNYGVTAKFSFLLHILNGRFVFPADDKLRIRVFCFKLFPKKDSGEKQIKSKKNKKKSKTENIEDESALDDFDDEDEDSPSIEELEEAAKAKNYESSAEKFRQIAHEINEEAIDDNPSVRKFIDKFIDFVKNIREKVLSIGRKLRDIHNNIEYYVDLINSDLFKRSLDLCKKQIFKLLKSVRPRKLKGIVHFGNENPQTVGMVFGLYSTVYPYIGKNIVFMPHFEEKIFTADLYMKGSITLFTVLIVAIKIYFNKDIKRTLKLLKREY